LSWHRPVTGAGDPCRRPRCCAWRGADDADRLFFDGALVMEGDTEFGLMLKNTLDAIGPLWAGTPR
jgi:hypothetical protein